MIHIVSVDPGRMKCGLILVNILTKKVIEGLVITPGLIPDKLKHWEEKLHLDRILLGNGTSSSDLLDTLNVFAPTTIVNEIGTTLRARRRYWQLWPPKNWRQIIPKGLLLPPDNIDAVAALLILEDHLNIKFTWSINPPNMKLIKNVL